MPRNPGAIAGVAALESDRRKQNAGPIVGMLVEIDDQGHPLVMYQGSLLGLPVRARSICDVAERDVGMEAALLFADGDMGKPIIMGLLRTKAATAKPVAIELDEQTFEFQAAKQIVLRCGDASITLTRAGKVLIRGKYVLSDSAGVNMVKGGVIRLN